MMTSQPFGRYGEGFRGWQLVVFRLLLAATLMIVLLPSSVYAAPEDAWSLRIWDIATVSKLHTVDEEVGYDGTVTEIIYDDRPSEGHCYAIVSISLTKNLATAEPLNLDELVFHIGDAGYSPVSPSWSFLRRHGYASFSSDVVASTSNGYLAFEIPSSYLDEDLSGARIDCGTFSSPEYSSIDTDIPFAESYVSAQMTIERNMLSAYESQGKATIHNPYIQLNPYGNAPLAAIAIFETDAPSSVNVRIHGKSESGDIEYSITDEDLHHEVPLYGLYPNYENSVTISANGESETISIVTGELPEDMLNISRVAGTPDAQQEGQLYLLQSPYQVAFDVNGEVRWYLTEMWSTDDCSYSFSFDGNGTGFWASHNPQTGSVYNWGCEVFHMMWTGRVDFLHSGSSDTQVHHAGCIGPNGEYLYFSANQVYSLDPSTGVASLWLDLDELFNPSEGAINVEAGGSTSDPWHANSIEYLSEDDSIVMSLRNQQMIMKLDYGSKVLEWVFTNASGIDRDGNSWTRLHCNPEIVIRPAGDDQNFEWFFDQHDSNVISYDAEAGIMRLAIFDNGTFRYNYGDYPNDLTYSRMVVYEIDENDSTARQVFEYGKGRGAELYSQWYGSARYLPETDHYVGCFRQYNGSLNSHIIEADSTGNVIAEYQVENAPYGVYRAYPVNLSTLELHNLDLCSYEGIEKHGYAPNHWTIQERMNVTDSIDATFSTLSRDEHTISVSGTLKMSSTEKMNNPKLIASGTMETYAFNLINSSDTAGQFYGCGVDISSLPEDVYTISVVATLNNGGLVEAQTGKTLVIGSGEEGEIEITTSDPDGSQQQKLLDLASTAREHVFEDAILVQDPFGVAPLTAALCFSTDSLSSVKVTVHGKTSDANISYDVRGSRRSHIVPIWGLYYNDSTDITVTCTDASGEESRRDFSVITGEAPEPAKMPQISCTLNEDLSDQITPGLTFCATIGSYHFAVDKYGDVRWYYSDSSGLGDSGITFNDQQHLLVLTPKSASAATNSFSMMEMDLLGRKYKEYFIDGSFHHEVKVKENGHILCAASKQGKKTINDYIVELDPKTGEVVRSWNIDEILAPYGVDLNADPVWGYELLSGEDGTSYTKNWFHNNCIYYDEREDSFILSSRHRSMVLKVDASSNKVIWVLGDHDLLEDTGLASYLLTPVDADGNEIPNDLFEWQYAQHAPTVLENGDLLLFDNGDYRSRYAEDAVSADRNYSRMVQFHIDEEGMTVSAVWQFGKELGSQHYCTYVGDADELGQNHYLGTFGGHFIDSEGTASDAMSGINTASLFEVVGNQIIWQLDTAPNDPIRSSGIYRSERLNISSIAYSYDELSGVQWVGNYLGTAQDFNIEIGSYSVGDSGVTISSIKNEGNRISVAGTLDEGLQLEHAYLYLTTAAKNYVYIADISTGDTISCDIILPAGFAAQDAFLYVLTERTDGVRIRQKIPYQMEQTDAFSLAVTGDTRITVGESKKLHVKLSPSSVLDEAIEWTSSDPLVAEVDSTGTVRARMAGTAVISARARSGAAQGAIIIDVTGVSIEREELTIRLGDQYALKGSALWEDTSDHSIAWSSSNTDVATVDENGLVTAVEKGVAEIRAASNGKTAVCTITVQPRIDEGVYAITSCLPGAKSLDIASGSSDNGANVQIWDANHTVAQQFYFAYVGNGEYVIYPQNSSGKCLDVQNAASANGTSVWQWEANDTAAQRWYLNDCGDDAFNLISVATGKYLDVASAQTANGTNVHTWDGNGSDAQRFRLSQLFHDGIYVIEPQNAPGSALDISGGSTEDGANLQIWSRNDSAAQGFIIRNEGAGEYSISSIVSGKMVDLSGACNFDGANVAQWSPNGSSAQRWKLQHEKDGTFSIVSCSSGRYLDVASGSTADGTNVQTWQGNDTNAQRFKLIEVSAQYVLESAIDESYVVDIAAASTSDGAIAQLWSKNGSTAQLFSVWGRNPAVILSSCSNKSLDVTNGGVDNGTPVQQYQYNSSLSQEWYLEYAGDGYYRIVSANSGKCLDVQNGVAFEGARLQIFERNDSDAQLFRLVSIE